MAENAKVTALVVKVGRTPGWRIESTSDGSYKLVREAIGEVPAASLKISPRCAERQYNNRYHDLKKLGWSEDLYETLQTLDRDHRIAGTDSTSDVTKALLDAYGVTEDAKLEKAAAARRKVINQRHAKGGTATGSSRNKVAARVGAAIENQPAAKELIEGAKGAQAEWITPERALDLIVNLASYQRSLRQDKVREYAEMMKRGEWVLDPSSPLCIDWDGKTANGQHRLHAVVESETKQPFLVVYDVDPATYKIMDRAIRRTTADMLYGAGEALPQSLAVLTKFAWLWFHADREHGWKNHPPVTDTQASQMLQEHPGLRESAKYGRIGGGVPITTRASTLGHYLMAQAADGDYDLVTRWYRDMGALRHDNNQPGHTLARYLLRTPLSRRKSSARPRAELELYLLIRAWNNTCAGKEMASIAYKPEFYIPNPDAPGPNARFLTDES